MEQVKQSKKAGVYCLHTLIAGIIIMTLLVTVMKVDTVVLELFTSVFTAAVAYLYLEFLKGVSTIASLQENILLKSRTQQFIQAVWITSVFFVVAPIIRVLVPNEMTILALFVVELVVLVYLGIMSLKIAKAFSSVDNELKTVANEVAKYHKIAGYLMVTVVLGYLGVLISLVADFKKWKFQKEFLKLHYTANNHS